MILVTKETFVIVSGPVSICVFLPLLVFTPPFGLLAVLDLFVFVTTITLYRNFNNDGINDLPFLGLKTLLSEKVVEGGKELNYCSCFYQIFSETPGGRCIWNLTGGMKAKEPGKRIQIKNLEF